MVQRVSLVACWVIWPVCLLITAVHTMTTVCITAVSTMLQLQTPVQTVIWLSILLLVPHFNYFKWFKIFFFFNNFITLYCNYFFLLVFLIYLQELSPPPLNGLEFHAPLFLHFFFFIFLTSKQQKNKWICLSGIIIVLDSAHALFVRATYLVCHRK